MMQSNIRADATKMLALAVHPSYKPLKTYCEAIAKEQFSRKTTRQLFVNSAPLEILCDLETDFDQTLRWGVHSVDELRATLENPSGKYGDAVKQCAITVMGDRPDTTMLDGKAFAAWEAINSHEWPRIVYENPEPPKRKIKARNRGEQMASATKSLWEIHPSFDNRYLLKEWLDTGALAVCYGAPNVGKTFLMLDVALHIAAGIPWHGVKTRKSRVLYCAAEGGAGLDLRLEAIKQRNPALWALAAANFAKMQITLDLHGNADVDAIIAMASKSAGVDLIIIDTLARSLGGGDENSTQDMSRAVNNATRLQHELNATVLFVHHSGKDSDKGARGSTALLGAVDTEIQLKGGNGPIEARHTKQRDNAKAAFRYMLEPVTLGYDQDDDAVTSCVVVPDGELNDLEPKKHPIGVTRAIETFLEAARLHGKLNDKGEFDGLHIDQWRDVYYAKSTADGQDNKRKSFERDRKSAVERKQMKVSNDVYSLSGSSEADNPFISLDIKVGQDKQDIAGQLKKCLAVPNATGQDTPL